MGWAATDIAPQAGRCAVVTGANSGIGYHTALELARAGARVVLACRDPDRADAAAGRIAATTNAPQVEVLELDLADLDSVRRAGNALHQRLGGIDVLVNNAGVMAVPHRLTTAQGFELQMGTNHLGHAALTASVLDLVLARPGARVVTVSSVAHRSGRIDPTDPLREGRYSPWGAYGRSKLANLLFAFELDRRLRAGGHDVASVAAHPGFSATNLQASGPRLGAGPLASALARGLTLGTALLGQSDAAGALPSLYAAVDVDVRGGDYIGPDGPLEIRGAPRQVGCSGSARDRALGEALWSATEAATRIRFDALR